MEGSAGSGNANIVDLHGEPPNKIDFPQLNGDKNVLSGCNPHSPKFLKCNAARQSGES